MKTSLRNGGKYWLGSYTDNEGIEHEVGWACTKDRLIHDLLRIIGNLDSHNLNNTKGNNNE